MSDQEKWDVLFKQIGSYRDIRDLELNFWEKQLINCPLNQISLRPTKSIPSSSFYQGHQGYLLATGTPVFVTFWRMTQEAKKVLSSLREDKDSSMYRQPQSLLELLGKLILVENVLNPAYPWTLQRPERSSSYTSPSHSSLPKWRNHAPNSKGHLSRSVWTLRHY